MRRVSGQSVSNVLAVGVGVASLAAALYALPGAVTSPVNSLSVGIHAVEVGALVVVPIALAHQLRRCEWDRYPPDVAWTVVEWFVAGALATGLVALLGAIHLLVDAPSSVTTISVVHTVASLDVGAVLGVTVGERSARVRMNAADAAQRRDDFAFLNRVLRHHVLNGVNVIDGHAELLESAVPESEREHVEHIRQRSAAVTRLVQNVRAVTTALSDRPGGVQPHPVTDVVAAARDRAAPTVDGTDAEVTVDVPEGVEVMATDLLPIAVAQLLTNAVEHHDGNPHVCVTARRDGDVVYLRVADDGPGIPDAVKESATAAGSVGNRGFGLYLVRVVVERQNGAVVIEDNDPRGTVVELTLPAAPA